ncbi:hypothetical protein CASFOL_027218 [Castilleja foliolosa]|uniref:RING-type E3 ubiquitin transferase n=1 Tax=Castilleja foliolosa TaxID=1961234 RepID=A0ABD3CHL5_9LAMI
MEVPGMDEVNNPENLVTSAAAFVEGGVQDACDDACSICLEDFTNSEPSTVTICKHEFHLQCILEWCQRSSNCPMCWQSVSLKDLNSQELLEAIERDRDCRLIPPRNATIFHHPTFGDFEVPRLPEGVNGQELEERIIQHLAAAAAMGRTQRIARTEGSRSRSSAYTRPQFMVFSANSNASSTESSDQSHPLTPVQSNQISSSSYGSVVTSTTRQAMANENRNFASESSSLNLDSAGPSELQSLSDTWKSRLSSVSMKYKESISKSTREWKEKFLSRSSSIADISSEVRREVNAGIATVSRMMERLEIRDNNRECGVNDDLDSS